MTYRVYRNYRECLNMIESLRRFDESEVAKQRDKIIRFYTEFGEETTKKVFGVDLWN